MVMRHKLKCGFHIPPGHLRLSIPLEDGRLEVRVAESAVNK
jgi:hypothetical protein